jgi:ATP-dependent Lhr-like helicase
MFEARWRWNVTRSLVLPRMDRGRRVPTPLQRMRAQDELTRAFPAVLACPETLPGGPVEVPWDHPLVRQTVEDCLHEAMDVDGFLEVVRGLRDGTIERVALDVPEPSAFARGILAAKPYGFLDDAPLEERRTHAVMTRRTQEARVADGLGALDPDAVARVRAEAWPDPRDAEEVHEALLWMGYVTVEEAAPWAAWLETLAASGRVALEGDRWHAVEASRDPLEVLRGRLEALGPVDAADDRHPAEEYRALEAQGVVLRVRLEGRDAWCERRLLARIHRATLDRLRREIEPTTAADFLRFLAAWQHAVEPYRLEGVEGVLTVVRQLAGFEVPAAHWERRILSLRVRGYQREWLDALTLRGEVAWGRLWGDGAAAARTTPIALFPREDLDLWLSLAPRKDAEGLVPEAAAAWKVLRERGALFAREIGKHARLLPAYVDSGLAALVARGLVTCDAYAGLRGLLVPASRRRGGASEQTGRWSLLDAGGEPAAPSEPVRSVDEATAEAVARRLLSRTGVVFRRTLVRERVPVAWRDLLRALRRMELRGEVRGGRFVAGFDGEQYAMPEAVTLLRSVRRSTEERPPLVVAASDPLNQRGILTPDERVAPTRRTDVVV